MVARKDGLVECHAGQAGLNRGLRYSLGCGFLLEVLEPGFECAGAAGRRKRRRRRKQRTQRKSAEGKASGHLVVHSEVDSLSTLVSEPDQMFEATAAKTRLLVPRQRRECAAGLDAQFVGSLMGSGSAHAKPPVHNQPAV